ncbi:MAG TPA: aminotransferase class V-fold PLP-dependent enzyme [Myxococcota bacterium]|nr:aminotransferase class V-fold PLP-dependent enzyme [Myxococcota bacterium]HRY92030.1 aminotransferase class V-fold PLP-dependent enzyme [Myxococcota bacterium]HSA21077.1 aminotransferase class V-fold PLP-dependent enzyme [Myxococcota bacterium]
MIYLDNAATSWPKPDSVPAAMERFLREHGANPGRSGHALSIQAGRVVYDARERVARLLGHGDPLSVVFTKNATEALNLALQGLLQPGDQVITSTMEHNSVLRPLRFLEGRGVEVSRLPCGADGSLDPADVARSISTRTRLVVLSHASNVVGTLCPIAEIGRLTADREILFCVDAAQSAGAVPIDMASLGVDLLAFTGHKSLYGPQGTGGLCIGERAKGRLRPLLHGGTGSASDADVQPEFLPDCFEAGTLNAVGLAGLAAGLEFVEGRGLGAIRAHAATLTARLLDGLRGIPRVRVLGTGEAARQTAVVSFNLDGWSCSEVAQALEERAGVCCRAGLHCAPLAHRQLGTFPEGAVRFSLGLFNTETEIATALGALRELAVRPKGDLS